MPCYHPIPGWFAKSVNETGKRSVVFDVNAGFKDKPVSIPCGSCIGCRLERARQWAVRCVHESKLHEENCFVTLTYDDKKLPDNMSLRPRDYVLFMKRLRKHFGAGVRFFQCGEYGDDTARPHHHALLFNCGFSDRVFYRNSASGCGKLYTSRLLEDLWGHGFCTIGSASFEAAGYIARYSLKKVFGPAADSYYGVRVPEYVTMSRRPGIGADWFKRYWRDWYPSDELVVDGNVSKPPRYYDDLVEKVDGKALREVKRRRIAALIGDENNSGSRLLVREAVKLAAVRNLSGCEDYRQAGPGSLPSIYCEDYGHV